MSAARRSTLEFSLVDGAGNRFVLVDALHGAAPADPSSMARELCGGGVTQGGRADGLLLLTPPRTGGDAALAIFNADGSVAEACGNGLRCAVWRLLRGREVGDEVMIETLAGERSGSLVDGSGTMARVRVGMGRGRTFELERPPHFAGAGLTALGASLGNPHCVLRVDDERTAPVSELGAAMQDHPLFAQGVNVGFLARRARSFNLRVFERGVGETAACGSGACAAALCAGGLFGADDALAGSGLAVQMPGGALLVEQDDDGELFLTGEARVLGRFDPEVG